MTRGIRHASSGDTGGGAARWLRGRLGVLVATVVVVTAASTSGALALWTSGVSATTSIAAGTLGVSQTGSNSLAVTYNYPTEAVTAPITVTNTGTVSSSPYSLTFAVSSATTPAGATALATTVSVSIWSVASTGACTSATTVGSGAVTGNWTNLTPLTGTLAPSAAAVYCVRSTITDTGVQNASTASVTISATATSALGTNWTTTSASTFTQTVADVAPTVPGTPTAYAWVSYAVGINWAPSVDVTTVKNYDVYYSTDNVNFTLQGTTPDAGTYYSAYGLSAATNYWFKVRARDTAGNLSAFSGTLLAPTIPAFGTANFRVTNSAGTSCFTAANGAVSGNGVTFATCVTPATPPANQKWVFTQNNTFFYQVNTAQSSLVWSSIGTTSGSPLQVNTNTGATAQIWVIIPQGSGLYQIKNNSSGNCLSVSGTNTIQESSCAIAPSFKLVTP